MVLEMQWRERERAKQRKRGKSRAEEGMQGRRTPATIYKRRERERPGKDGAEARVQ